MKKFKSNPQNEEVTIITTLEYVDTADDTKEDEVNKVTELTEASTDEEYPSAKAVYDLVSPHIPKVLEKVLLAGATSLIFSDSAITNESHLDLYADTYGIAPKTCTITPGQVSLTFKPYSTNITIRLELK